MDLWKMVSPEEHIRILGVGVKELGMERMGLHCGESPISDLKLNVHHFHVKRVTIRG